MTSVTSSKWHQPRAKVQCNFVAVDLWRLKEERIKELLITFGQLKFYALQKDEEGKSAGASMRLFDICSPAFAQRKDISVAQLLAYLKLRVRWFCWKARCSRLELPFLSIRTWWPSSRQDKLEELEVRTVRTWFWFCPCKPSKCQKPEAEISFVDTVHTAYLRCVAGSGGFGRFRIGCWAQLRSEQKTKDIVLYWDWERLTSLCRAFCIEATISWKFWNRIKSLNLAWWGGQAFETFFHVPSQITVGDWHMGKQLLPWIVLVTKFWLLCFSWASSARVASTPNWSVEFLNIWGVLGTQSWIPFCNTLVAMDPFRTSHLFEPPVSRVSPVHIRSHPFTLFAIQDDLSTSHPACQLKVLPQTLQMSPFGMKQFVQLLLA